MEDQPKAVFIQSLIIGAYFGILNIIIALLLYIFRVNMVNITFSIIYFIFNIGISILFFVYGMKYIRDNYLNGVISYGYKFLIGLIIGLISAWIGGILSVALYVYYDPGFIAEQIDKLIIKFEDLGMDETVVFKQEQKLKDSFTLIGQIKTIFIRTPIFIIILSLIISVFVKKEKETGTNQML